MNDNRVDREKVLKEANEYLDKVNIRVNKSLEIIKDLPKKKEDPKNNK